MTQDGLPETAIEALPPVPLSYASRDDFGLVRPLLWLIFALPIGQILYDLSSYTLYAVMWLTSQPIGTFTSPYIFVSIAYVVKTACGVGVMVTAWSAVRTRRLRPVHVLCNVLAVGNFGCYAVSVLVQYIMTAGAYGSQWPQYRAQILTSGLATAFASVITPLAAAAAIRAIRHRLEVV